MTEPISKISNKYKKYYFGLKETIKKGSKVIYIPDYNGFIHLYHDAVYDYFKFRPGDILTVERVEKDDPCYGVYFLETKCSLSPAELLPIDVVNKEDIKKVLNFYKEYKRKHKV